MTPQKGLHGTTQSRQIRLGLGQEAAHDGAPLGVGHRTDTRFAGSSEHRHGSHARVGVQSLLRAF